MIHKLGVYHDGYQKVPYCEVCSADGEKLLDACQGPLTSNVLFFKHMTREQFEKEFGPVDEKYLTK